MKLSKLLGTLALGTVLNGCAASNQSLDELQYSQKYDLKHGYWSGSRGTKTNIITVAGLYAGLLDTQVSHEKIPGGSVTTKLSQGIVSGSDQKYVTAYKQALRDADLNGDKEITSRESFDLIKRVNRSVVENWKNSQQLF
jgi:hypothetical protein